MRQKATTERRQYGKPDAENPAWSKRDVARAKPFNVALKEWRARRTGGLTQEKLAAIMGVSVRTLQGWEQGRRKPSGAARALLAIARARPEVLRELFAE
ncbi:MAG TPA: helix-turn-helix domain-containing protein [Steroidobacteraceae bacterium]|nr:helix-turn-helix domain-containing protein [Steroidobacteraceae bacterium]